MSKKHYAKETRTRKPILSPKSMRSNRSVRKDPVEGISLVTSGRRVQGRRELGNPGQDHHHHHPDETHPRRSSLERNSNSQRSSSRPSSRPSSRSSQHANPVLYETISYQQSPIPDIDDTVSSATHAQNQYYQDRNIPTAKALSPRDQLAAPFLNQNFEKKKKKKMFSFGKK